MGEVDDAGDAVGEPVRDIVGDGELLRVKDGVHDTLGDEDSEEDAAALAAVTRRAPAVWAVRSQPVLPLNFTAHFWPEFFPLSGASAFHALLQHAGILAEAAPPYAWGDPPGRSWSEIPGLPPRQRRLVPAADAASRC